MKFHVSSNQRHIITNKTNLANTIASLLSEGYASVQVSIALETNKPIPVYNGDIDNPGEITEYYQPSKLSDRSLRYDNPYKEFKNNQIDWIAPEDDPDRFKNEEATGEI